jgi:hypothetical protein
MIPSIAIVRVQNPYWHRNLRIWIPLFLIWLVLLPLVPIAFVVLGIVCLVVGVHPWRAISVGWGILNGLHGTDVEVKVRGKSTLVRIL